MKLGELSIFLYNVRNLGSGKASVQAIEKRAFVSGRNTGILSCCSYFGPSQDQKESRDIRDALGRGLQGAIQVSAVYCVQENSSTAMSKSVPLFDHEEEIFYCKSWNTWLTGLDSLQGTPGFCVLHLID